MADQNLSAIITKAGGGASLLVGGEKRYVANDINVDKESTEIDVMNSIHGSAPMDKVVTGTTWTITFDLIAPDAVVAATLPGASTDLPGNVEVYNLVGLSHVDNGAQIELRPLENTGESAVEHHIILPKCSPLQFSNYILNTSEQRVWPQTITVFPDDNNLLYKIGNAV